MPDWRPEYDERDHDQADGPVRPRGSYCGTGQLVECSMCEAVFDTHVGDATDICWCCLQRIAEETMRANGLRRRSAA